MVLFYFVLFVKQDDNLKTVTDLDPRATDPTRFPVAVIFKRKPSTNRWLRYSWQASGVLVDTRPNASQHRQRGVKIRSAADGDDFFWSGLWLTLYKDEAESYYHNLMTPNPSLFIVTRPDEQEQPEPFIVSASFDEAHAYLEADDQAHAVPMPAEIYPWVERFILLHYVPEPRRKRQRSNWKNSGEAS